ncbi:hypothetical protein SLEP1_g22019 [Rubroshorea leprosula]|uniref:Ubiquitin carboxyl-terminal hydrolase n=1 Tax=Rubroshorea leprosula TaxID=152421 RepID=A0AAV5JIF4_9ROSI|nr:hypothetical protein SLEP1_g22019 [Rubroshorea leprosula]
MQTRVFETVGVGSSCSDSVISRENSDGSFQVLPLKVESVDGSSGTPLKMDAFVDAEALNEASIVVSPSNFNGHSLNSAFTACSVKSVCGSSMSSGGESVADRSLPLPSQNQALEHQSLDSLLSDIPSDSSAMDIDPVKNLTHQNWDGSSESSPPSKQTPLCLALVPYDSCSAMQTEIQENPPSELSLHGPASEEDGSSPKSDEKSQWRPWTPWSEARGDRLTNPSSENYPRRWSPHREERTLIEPTGVGAGLANLGNTCFINAILQCFTHTVPLVQGLRSYDHEKPCDRHREGFCMLCALCDHIDVSLNSSGWVVSPSNIFDNLNHISSCFQKYNQEDAHEFLQCLLDRLESCCLDLRSKSEDGLSSRDDNLVKRIFGGRLVSQLRCCNCGHCSDTYEPMVDLSLEIEDVDSLPSAIESFTKVEKLEDPEAKLRCSNCNEKVAMEKQLLLEQAPLVASFHLKRFKIDGYSVKKIDNHVEFPLELDLQPYTIINQDNNVELKYQLYAVVKHYGAPTAGHYVCYVRSSPNMWHRLNDSKVHMVEGESVLSEQAYILFYARQDIPWFSSVIEVQAPCLDPNVSNLSPKSVLDNIESAIPSDSGAGNNNECSSNESKDAADRMSMQFSYETKTDSAVNESSIAAEAYGSEQNVTELNESGAETPTIDANMPPRSSDCFEGLSDENICTVSPLGENMCNQDVDKACKSSGSPQTSTRSKSPEASYRIPTNHLKEVKRSVRKKSQNKPAMDSKRTEAVRFAKKMPSGRGERFIAAIMGPKSDSGVNKRRLRSSPCKKTSPRHRRNHGSNAI